VPQEEEQEVMTDDVLTPARCVRLILAVLLVGVVTWRLFDTVWVDDDMDREGWIGVGVCVLIVWALVAK
jgi:hypothetical protein